MSRKVAVLAVVGSLAGWVVVVDGGWAGSVGNWLSHLIGTKLWRLGLGWSRFFVTDYIVGIIVAINFCAIRVILADTKVISARFAKAIRFLSLLTFPLYLFHLPLVLFFASLSPTQLSASTRFIVVVVSTLVSVAILTPFCEFLRARMRVSLTTLILWAKTRWSTPSILEGGKAAD